MVDWFGVKASHVFHGDESLSARYVGEPSGGNDIADGIHAAYACMAVGIHFH